MTPLASVPTTEDPATLGAVRGGGGMLLAADVTGGTAVLLVVRWLGSVLGWRSHPAGPVTYDSAAAAGAATDARRYTRFVGDQQESWWHVVRQSGTGTLSAVHLQPVDFE